MVDYVKLWDQIYILNLRSNRFMSKKSSSQLSHIVEYIQAQSERFKSISGKQQTPFYAYDEGALDASVKEFNNTFKKYCKNFIGLYALKLNHHKYIVDRVVEIGMGLDVASKKELEIALKTTAKNIVFYSPGKSSADLAFAVKHRDRVRIHIDSFSELERLSRLTIKLDTPLKASVRVNFPFQGEWKKYGIALEELQRFWSRSREYKNIEIDGIHFHQSRNRTPEFYVKSIKMLGVYLKRNFTSTQLKNFKCIDFGGGFEPYLSEGVIVRQNEEWPCYKITKTATIEEYAKSIGDTINKYLNPLVDVVYYAEPGRFICNSAMHIVLSVADVKDEKNIILNGGVNMVGWQRFEYEYFPVINISKPSNREFKVNSWGNLCTTWDTWGYYMYGSGVSPGDFVVVPNQGALTYSLAQSFINKIPPVYKL